jgi:hypothetical protein
MIIGRLFCERCGKDCTDLYGFALMVRGTVRNQKTQEALAEVKKVFGKEEFVWCWSCTAKAFGAMALEQLKTHTEKESETQQAVIETKKSKNKD